jgi:hypothetical protein
LARSRYLIRFSLQEAEARTWRWRHRLVGKSGDFSVFSPALARGRVRQKCEFKQRSRYSAQRARRSNLNSGYRDRSSGSEAASDRRSRITVARSVQWQGRPAKRITSRNCSPLQSSEGVGKLDQPAISDRHCFRACLPPVRVQRVRVRSCRRTIISRTAYFAFDVTAGAGSSTATSNLAGE